MDGTPECVHKCKTRNQIFLQHKGSVYSSWNVGLKECVANYEYISFLGVGDRFNELFLTWFFEQAVTAKNLIFYGDIIGNKIHHAKRQHDFNSIFVKYFACMPIPHAGTIFPIDLFKGVGEFSSEFEIVGDLDWLLRLSDIHHVTVKRYSGHSIWMRPNGISTGRKNIERLIHEELKVCRLHNRLPCPKRFAFLIFMFIISKFKG